MKAFKSWQSKRKFKKAGTGHVLGDGTTASSSSSSSSSSSTAPPPSTATPATPATTRRPEDAPLSDAAQAALARMEGKGAGGAGRSGGGRAKGAMGAMSMAERRRARAALAKEPCPVCGALVLKSELARHVGPCKTASKRAAARAQEERLGLAYLCPLCGVSVPKSQALDHLRSCCAARLDEDPVDVEAAATLVLTAPKAVRDPCVTTILKYLDNILSHPDDPKYRRIKTSNKVFSTRIAPVHGALSFFWAIGFEEEPPANDDSAVSFLVLEDGFPLEALAYVREGLASKSLKLALRLDRNLQIIAPDAAAATAAAAAGSGGSREHDPSFYERSAAELAADMAAQRAAIEEAKVVRARKTGPDTGSTFMFCVVRFAVGRESSLVQGTFATGEPASELFSFVSSITEPGSVFALAFLPDRTARDLDSVADLTIGDLGLGPAALVAVTSTDDRDLALNVGPTPL